VSATPWYLRPFFRNQRRKYGHVLTAALLWARVRRLFISVATLYGALERKRSPLDPALRSLVTVRVSQLNGREFCVDINTATLLKRGTAMDKVEALASWRHSPLFDARDRAALVALQNLSAKFNSALGVPAQGLCRLPGGPSAGAGPNVDNATAKRPSR
jgi:AhpD family alkylhydroperoxidase